MVYVGSGHDTTETPPAMLAALLPVDDAVISGNKAVIFSWAESNSAVFYRVEVQDLTGREILAALLQSGVSVYSAPSWLRDRAPDGKLRWRVVALDQNGGSVGETQWYRLSLTP